jgi:hypothetical protein
MVRKLRNIRLPRLACRQAAALTRLLIDAMTPPGFAPALFNVLAVISKDVGRTFS